MTDDTPLAPDPPAVALAEPQAATADGDGCPCCEAARAGAYCHGCGQHYLDGPITLRLLARQFAERFLKLERGLSGRSSPCLAVPAPSRGSSSGAGAGPT